MKVSKQKINAVSSTFASAALEEFNEQQGRIYTAYESKQNTRVAIDTSFSQVRNAQYSQTAALESASGEIIKIEVLDKKIEKCSSNSLEALGVEKLIDNCLHANVPMAVISTDECGSVASLLRKKSNIQLEKFGFEIIPQNDPFHKLKNY